MADPRRVKREISHSSNLRTALDMVLSIWSGVCSLLAPAAHVALRISVEKSDAILIGLHLGHPDTCIMAGHCCFNSDHVSSQAGCGVFHPLR